jgi:hypothetical protein
VHKHKFGHNRLATPRNNAAKEWQRSHRGWYVLVLRMYAQMSEEDTVSLSHSFLDPYLTERPEKGLPPRSNSHTARSASSRKSRISSQRALWTAWVTLTEKLARRRIPLPLKLTSPNAWGTMGALTNSCRGVKFAAGESRGLALFTAGCAM